jgi:hypothetical protein
MRRASGSCLCLVVTLFGFSACRRAANTGQNLTITAGALAEEPETGSAAAVYQRYRRRHEILASMKSDLLNLVAAEAAFFSDSSKYAPYTSCVKPPTQGAAAWCESPGNTLDGIHMTQLGWWATITNLNTAIHCAVAVGPDTSFGAPSGTPVCFGVSTPPAGYPKSPL